MTRPTWLIMSQRCELNFENVRGTYNALWDLGGRLVTDPKVGNRDNWLLTFRHGLRGMLARLITVDRSYVQLHEVQSTNPNEWGEVAESHAAVVFFGMDSAVECFVFAMNAVGFLKSRGDFCDITDAKALRQINPKNILGGDPTDSRNPKPGYQKFFPRVVAHFKASEKLLATIFEYHDVSKHRSAVISGGSAGTIYVRDDPKNPDSLMSSASHTVESLAQGFQEFMDELLPIALEEASGAFGYTCTKRVP